MHGSFGVESVRTVGHECYRKSHGMWPDSYMFDPWDQRRTLHYPLGRCHWPTYKKCSTQSSTQCKASITSQVLNGRAMSKIHHANDQMCHIHNAGGASKSWTFGTILFLYQSWSVVATTKLHHAVMGTRKVRSVRAFETQNLCACANEVCSLTRILF